MIRKKEYFSKQPVGMIWLCSKRDEVQMRYGRITVSLPDAFVDELLEMTFDSDTPRPYCKDCGGVHLEFEHAILNIAGPDFDHLLVALYHLTRKPSMPNQVDWQSIDVR